MQETSIFNDFLTDLGVPHTRDYSNTRFGKMTFRSLFGLSKLLESYGIANEALQLSDTADDLDKLTPPFIACTRDGMVIVRQVTDKDLGIRTDTDPTGVRVPRDTFMSKWDGIVLLAYPDEKSREPEYSKHRILDIATTAKKWVLLGAAVFIFAYLFVANGLYRNAGQIIVAMIDIVGLFVTYQLVLKSLNIHTSAGDSICGILDRSGCHSVLSSPAAKFLGIFGWAEVGLAYFSVSLGCLLVFPQYTGYLALINACCCPFSFWSVWYQKYRVGTWCTLCLITQACLWGVLITDIAGGLFHGSFPLGIQFFVLCASYVVVLLGLNAVMPSLDRNPEQIQK